MTQLVLLCRVSPVPFFGCRGGIQYCAVCGCVESVCNCVAGYPVVSFGSAMHDVIE